MTIIPCNNPIKYLNFYEEESMPAIKEPLEPNWNIISGKIPLYRKHQKKIKYKKHKK
jgi:hypothetical protein